MIRLSCYLVSARWLTPLALLLPLYAAQADDAATGPLATSVGRQVSAFQLPDYRGTEYQLSDFSQYPVLVVAVLGNECPLAKLYGPRLAALAAEFKDRGVGFVGINANRQDSITEIAAYARRHGIDFPILKDLGQRVIENLGATRTPEVFLLDDRRVVRYQGRIDDQYGVGYVREQPQRHELRTAIVELLEQKSIAQPFTEAVGCIIGRITPPDPDASVTYTNQIARILQDRCVECHRDGEIAPFSLTAYEEVVGWAPMIEEVVREERMPPWHAADAPGRFHNDRRLSEEDKQAIFAWVAAGAPEGDRAELPPAREWTTGWQLPSEPDFVAPLTQQPYRVPAEGSVEYQYFHVDPGFAEDKWVKVVEIQPGNRAVVHHVLMFSGTSFDVRERFASGARGYDGIYVPGQRVRPYPDGAAKRIAAGSQLYFQVHYTPIGSEQLDQSRVGIVFADPLDVEYEVVTASAVNPRFRVPAGASSHRVVARSEPLPENAQLISMTPHMHLRGKAFSYEMQSADGEPITLLDVPRYDFNWQTAYRLVEPVALPGGERIRCVAQFDNSEDNLNNPDPTVDVTWGPQTWEEMMIGYFDYLVPRGSVAAPPARSRPRGPNRVRRIFERLDRSEDGVLSIEEIPEQYRNIFAAVDKNGDGQVTLEEFAAVIPGR